MILILDDFPLVRQGLSAIVQMHRPQETILQAGTVEEAIELAEQQEIAIAFIDVRLSNGSGFSFLQWLKEHRATVKTFMITASSRQEDFLRAKKLGVEAYVLKDAFIDEIMYGLKVVERGGKFYSSSIVDGMAPHEEADARLQSLTAREKEVLALLHEGHSNAVIGQKLFISEGTIKKHISSILSKLELKNRVEAVVFASRNAAALQLPLHAPERGRAG